MLQTTTGEAKKKTKKKKKGHSKHNKSKHSKQSQQKKSVPRDDEGVQTQEKSGDADLVAAAIQ